MKANLSNEAFFLDLIVDCQLYVTKSGKAYNLNTGKEIATTSKKGYRKISWQDPTTKKIRQIQLHRLVWCAFKGIPPNAELEVNHKDGNKQRCCLSNLELVRPRKNLKHARRLGLLVDPKGERKPNALFKDKDVIRYRKLYALGKITASDVVKEVGCSMPTASWMLSGRTWKHLN